MLKYLVLPAMTLLLAGCNNAVSNNSLTTGSVVPIAKKHARDHVIARRMPASEAFARIRQFEPDIIDVVETRGAGSIKQRIVFESAGTVRHENTLTIALDDARKSKAPSSARQIKRELASALPGTNMRIINSFHSNQYGPYGLAKGYSKQTGHCVFGWQQIRQAKSAKKNPLLVADRTLAVLNVRLNVCASKPGQVDNLMQSLEILVSPRTLINRDQSAWSTAAPVSVPSMGFSQHASQAYESVTVTSDAPVQKKRRPSRVVAAVSAKPQVKSKVPAQLVPSPEQDPAQASNAVSKPKPKIAVVEDNATSAVLLVPAPQ